jgi:tetratricopeptide (TPR) repeat protein
MKLVIRVFCILIPLAVFVSCSKSDSSQGDQFFSNQQYEQAVEAYSDVLVNNTKNVNALYKRGRAYEELGNLDEAEKDFKSAYDLDSRNVQVLMSLSNLYQKRKDNEMALQYASYAAEIPGAPAMAFFLKGRAYHLLGNTENALTEYSTAVKIDEDFGQAYYYRGMLKRAIKQNRGACTDLKLANSLNYPQATEALERYCK